MQPVISSRPVSLSPRYVFADTTRRNRSLVGLCLIVMAIPALLIVGLLSFFQAISRKIFS